MNNRIPSYFTSPREFSTYRWWRPILEALLAAFLWIVFVVCMYVPVIILSIFPHAGGLTEVIRNGSLDMTDPLVFAITLMTLAALIPAVLIAVRLAGKRPMGSVVSVCRRFRWRVFARASALSVLCFLLLNAASWAWDGGPITIPSNVWVMLLLTIILVPLQSAGEEFAFRGLLGQWLGSWTRHPLGGILIPLPLFVLGHDYEIWGLIDVGFFALCVGVIAWKTHGLEGAIALHAANNTIIFAGAAVGLVDPNATDISVASTLLSVVVTALASGLIIWDYRRQFPEEKQQVIHEEPYLPYRGSPTAEPESSAYRTQETHDSTPTLPLPAELRKIENQE